MADRRVKVTFSAEVQNYKAAMEAAAKSTEAVKKAADDAGKATELAGSKADAGAKKAADSAAKHKDALERVGTAATIGGAAVLAGVGLAVKSYADFDKQMSSVDAVTHETAGNMALLREAAVKAGADTAFSASEAARGIEEMAKAGVSTKDILGGGLTGALSLAAAGSLDVGKAAEIASSAMTQFKLSGDKLPHVADLLAAGAGKAQGSVEDLGAALNQSGLVASQTGLTIEETTGGLAAFASAGLTGSDAGTSFKSMLQRLNPQSKEAANLMEELGLSAYDSQGNFIGLSEYAGELQKALGGMTTEQRNATLSTLFGSDAIRAASVLYENGAEGVQKWESAVNDAGYAADTAARMQDNLAGDLEKLGGSFDTVLIQSGSGANDVLRGLVQGLEGLVDAVGKVPGPVLAVGTGLAAVVGGAGLVGGALITIIPKIKETKDAFNDLAPAGGRARNALESVGKAAGVAAALGGVTLALAKWAESGYMAEIETGMGGVNNALQDVAGSSPGAASALDAVFKDRNGGDLINTVDGLDSAIKRTFNRDAGQSFNDWGESLVNTFTGVKGSSQILDESFKRLDTGLADLVSSGNQEGAAKSFEKIKASAEAQGVSVDDLLKKFPDYADALKQAEADAKAAGAGGDAAAKGIKGAGDAASAATEPSAAVAKALEEIGLNADGSIASLEKFTTALLNTGLIELSARDASRNWSQALLDMGLQADGTGGKIGALGTEFDNTTAQGIKNQEMFDGVAQAGIRNVEAMAKNGSSQKDLQGALSGTYAGLIATAGQFGITGGAADTLARKVLGVPDGVSVTTWMDSQAKAMAESTKGAIDNIPRYVAVNIETYKTTFERLVGLPASVSDGSYGQGLGVYAPGRATGGRLPGFADGGQLPTTGPGTGVTDGFLGISSAGVPMARVDAGEWIINGESSNRYNRELAAINAGTFPKLPGFADGGRFGVGQGVAPGFNAATIAAAVAGAMSGWQPVVSIGGREFYGLMADSTAKARRR